MSRPSRSFAILAVAVAAGLLVARTAPAQTYVEPYLGAILLDDGGFDVARPGGGPAVRSDLEADPTVVLGGRLGHRFAERWAIEATYGFAPVSLEAEGSDADVGDASTHLYYGGIVYHVPLRTSTGLFVTAGFGGITFDPDNGSSITDAVLSVGGGVRIPLRETTSIRIEARDHLQLCSAPIRTAAQVAGGSFGLCGSDDTLHQVELSAGIAFRF